MKEIMIGEQYTKTVTVTEELLAKTVGSGNVEVYATPMMLALMEGAAAELTARFLDEGETSVGSRIESSHLLPTLAGGTVTATATVIAAEGRKISFSVKAEDEGGLIGEGTHDRVVVGLERFMQKAAERKNSFVK